jgi:hypothetical protein
MAMPDSELRPAPAFDLPRLRLRRWWLWATLAGLPALILLSSEVAYAFVGMFGMLLFLPMGALSWLLVWLSLLATALLLSPLFDPLVPQLAPRLGLDDGVREIRQHRLRWMTRLVLGASLLAGLGLGTPSRQSTLPLCCASDMVWWGVSLVSGMMGHGRAYKPRACRPVEQAQPGPWIPLLVALPLLLALRRAEDARHKAQLDAERLALRPMPARPDHAVQRAEPDALDPTSESERVLPIVASSAAVEDAHDPPAAAEVPARMPPPVALSVRSQAVLEARRRNRRDDGSARHGALAALICRWPVLSIGLGCYLVGWALEIAGSDLPLRIAEALTPALLRRTLDGWPLLGLWASTLVAFAGGALLSWLRRGEAEPRR